MSALRIRNDRQMTSSTAMLVEKHLREYLPRCQMLCRVMYFYQVEKSNIANIMIIKREL